MRIAFFQFRPARADTERNLASIVDALGDAEFDLVVLPELATTGYLFADREQALAQAETVDGRTVDVLSSCCARGSFHMVCGLAERDGGRVFNSAVLLGPSGHLATYRKAHLFLDEKRIFDAGDTGFVVHEVAGVRVGILVCFDWIFPESSRSLALAGARIIAHPSNLVLPWAQQATVTRCIENRVFWVLANRTGEEEEGGRRLAFTGRSRITAPGGRVLLDAGAAEDTLGFVDVDPTEAVDKRVNDANDLFVDRRPDLYHLLIRPPTR